MEDEGAAARVFFSERVTQDDLRGDLSAFVTFFEEPGRRVLLIAQSVKRDEVAGFWWLDDIIPNLRASANIFCRRRYWGAPAQEMTELGCRFAFQALGVRALWAYTPWRVAQRHALRCGFEAIATLPGFGGTAEAPLDIHILRKTRNG